MGSGGSSLIMLALVFGGAAHAACAPDTVELRGPSGVQRFSVEIADSEAERSKGLMFRDHMPASAGMLFIYDQPKHAYFWMKDTLLPLDMVFADATGLVTSVHSNAVPQDETPIDGGAGVAVVLEINAGLAKRMGIAPGVVMRSAALDQSVAAWRCSDE
ncbi:DUF192 domain-containing protein [Cypionkella sp.]|uniref:DUF192 domain-containing protein n=1 Tax=Cypionkella sp. TaxID=2811411 RepID=UPI00271BDD6C|nr:DUF192 domain-containing protein [Cypionkella sp.]MDO8983812.1 DUF192 domain-containing protein [Cypionkella sp.]MDP2051630.1 DUF192 domain-containing protein [Cypionkella sp.]